MTASSETAMSRRAIRAASALFACLLVVACSGRIGGHGLASQVEELDGKVAAGGLATFQEEAVSLEDCTEVHANDESTVIGWTERGPVGEVVSRRTRELEGKGWRCVPNGSSCMTFLKDEGTLRWLFVSYFEVSEEVSVVVQLAV